MRTNAGAKLIVQFIIVVGCFLVAPQSGIPPLLGILLHLVNDVLVVLASSSGLTAVNARIEIAKRHAHVPEKVRDVIHLGFHFRSAILGDVRKDFFDGSDILGHGILNVAPALGPCVVLFL